MKASKKHKEELRLAIALFEKAHPELVPFDPATRKSSILDRFVLRRRPTHQ